MGKPTQADAEAAVRTLIEWAGDDPTREGLLDTPARVARRRNQCDRIPANGDIADKRRTAIAVVDRSAPDHHVVRIQRSTSFHCRKTQNEEPDGNSMLH